MAFVYLTKAARTGAGWPHQQESGCLLGVAFAAIGTATFFANGVNLPLLDNLLDGRNFARLADRSP